MDLLLGAGGRAPPISQKYSHIYQMALTQYQIFVKKYFKLHYKGNPQQTMKDAAKSWPKPKLVRSKKGGLLPVAMVMKMIPAWIGHKSTRNSSFRTLNNGPPGARVV